MLYHVYLHSAMKNMDSATHEMWKRTLLFCWAVYFALKINGWRHSRNVTLLGKLIEDTIYCHVQINSMPKNELDKIK